MSSHGSIESDVDRRQREVLEHALALAERQRARRAKQSSTGTPGAVRRAGDPLVRAALRQGGVPERYWDGASWDRVRDPRVYEWATNVAARTWRRTDPMGRSGYAGEGMLLTGTVGSGKSSAAALCCIEAACSGRSVLWHYVPDMADILTFSGRQRAEVIRRQESVDLLVWDDFAARDLADWEIGFFDQVVEARYRNRKPMIVTSNLTPARLREDPRLERLVDRWSEQVCKVGIVLAGASQRRA